VVGRVLSRLLRPATGDWGVTNTPMGFFLKFVFGGRTWGLGFGGRQIWKTNPGWEFGQDLTKRGGASGERFCGSLTEGRGVARPAGKNQT